MTATHARELRRSRKRRVLHLLSAQPTTSPLAFPSDDASLEQIRQAMREWGWLPPMQLSLRGRLR